MITKAEKKKLKKGERYEVFILDFDKHCVAFIREETLRFTGERFVRPGLSYWASDDGLFLRRDKAYKKLRARLRQQLQVVDRAVVRLKRQLNRELGDRYVILDRLVVATNEVRAHE